MAHSKTEDRLELTQLRTLNDYHNIFANSNKYLVVLNHCTVLCLSRAIEMTSIDSTVIFKLQEFVFVAFSWNCFWPSPFYESKFSFFFAYTFANYFHVIIQFAKQLKWMRSEEGMVKTNWDEKGNWDDLDENTFSSLWCIPKHFQLQEIVRFKIIASVQIVLSIYKQRHYL